MAAPQVSPWGRFAVACQKGLVGIMDKQAFKKKWENYWYYYKWHTYAGIFIAILLFFFIKDMVTKEKFDATIMVVSSSYVDDSELSALADKAELYFPDIDQNGEVNIQISPIFIEGGEDGEPSDIQVAYAMQVKLLAEISSNRMLICIFDDGFSNLFLNQAELRELSKDFPDEPAVTGSVWQIADSQFAEDTFLPNYEKRSQRRFSASMLDASNLSKQEDIETYQKVLEGLGNMIKSKPVQVQ